MTKLRQKPNQLPADIEVRQYPEGCAIGDAMECMGMDAEGSLQSHTVRPLFEVVLPCEVEGCEVVTNLATIGSERTLFYKSRGKDAVRGVCQKSDNPNN